MKAYLKVVKAVSYMGQLGFTLLTPPLVLICLAWWIEDRFDVGTWVMALALVIGLITSAVSAYQLYRRILADSKKHKPKDEVEKPVVFYHHE